MESCELCARIGNAPTKNWETDLEGGEVTRELIGSELTAWSCPECGQPWLCVRNTIRQTKLWSKV